MPRDRTPVQLESHFALAACAAARAGRATNVETTLLHIGDEHALVVSGPGDETSSTRKLDLGRARIARDFFHHDPPTPHEIERAIDFAEDEIMRLGKPADFTSTLWTTSPAMQTWVDVSGPTMPLETVEQWFQRLVAAALGQPGAMQGLPQGREAAAILLVLREFMHHRSHDVLVAMEAPEDAATG